MKKTILLTTLFLSTFTLFSKAEEKNYTAVDEFGKAKFTINSKSYLKEAKIKKTNLEFDEKKLLITITNTIEYFNKNLDSDEIIKRTGFLGSMNVKVEDVLKTLEFIKETLTEDISKGKKIRMKDPDFINKNFKIITWKPYNQKDATQKNIRITKYAIFTHTGSKIKTKEFTIPLYEIKADSDFYKKYTKQEVLTGIYEKKGTSFKKAKPLVYLTRDGLEEALMEGTLLVKFNDGTKAFYNVDKNNGIAYVKGLKRESQKRYWYFKKVTGINGYGSKNIDNKIKIEDSVTFAADVFNIGLGKIVLLDYKIQGKQKLKLGIIADTGGAFLPNLAQLDFLAGSFKSRDEFSKSINSLPSYADVSFLIKNQL